MNILDELKSSYDFKNIRKENDIYLTIIASNFKLLNNNTYLKKIFKLKNGKKFILTYLEAILISIEDKLSFIECYYRNFINNDFFLQILAYHPNLTIRVNFMLTIEKINYKLLNKYYPNITDNLINKDSNNNIVNIAPEILVSKLAVNLLNNKYDKQLFTSLKEFILKNYKYNHLLSLMIQLDPLNDKNDYFHVYEELNNDLSRLFKSSVDYKLNYIHSNNRSQFSIHINNFKKIIIPLLELDSETIEEIFTNELGNEFLEYIIKYLKLSKNKIIDVGNWGTTTSTFIVGDYIIKYISHVYNYFGPENKCPSNFLVNKVYDQVIKYDENGNFLGMLEVQKNLNIPLRNDQKEIEELYIKELANLGLYCSDDLINTNKINVYRLNDYHDADCKNPESLPDWFKKNPYVLVDRDCVYPLEYVNNKNENNLLKLKKRIPTI